MTRTILFVLGVSLSGAALLSLGAGCGGSSSGNTGTGTNGTGGSTGSNTGTGTGGAMGSGGSTGTGPATLDCASYCGEVMTNCTGAALQQYTDMSTCLGFCATLPPGALNDGLGNTLGCRIYHGGAPAIADPTLHCPHAGPTGGDKDPMGAAGTCGEPCDAFCGAAIKICPDAFTDAAACGTACAAFTADTTPYSIADSNKNDMGCRMYHLAAASANATAAMTHCPHIVAASSFCVN